MYVLKWWRREETCGIPHVLTTYIVLNRDTRFKHTRFELDGPLSKLTLNMPIPLFSLSFFVPLLYEVAQLCLHKYYNLLAQTLYPSDKNLAP